MSKRFNDSECKGRKYNLKNANYAVWHNKIANIFCIIELFISSLQIKNKPHDNFKNAKQDSFRARCFTNGSL